MVYRYTANKCKHLPGSEAIPTWTELWCIEEARNASYHNQQPANQQTSNMLSGLLLRISMPSSFCLNVIGIEITF